jgi:hypothetical protein
MIEHTPCRSAKPGMGLLCGVWVLREHTSGCTVSPLACPLQRLQRCRPRCMVAVRLSLMWAAGNAETSRGIPTGSVARRWESCRNRLLLRRSRLLSTVLLLPRPPRILAVPNPSSNQRRVRLMRGPAYSDGVWSVRVKLRFETLAPGSFGHPKGTHLEAPTASD